MLTGLVEISLRYKFLVLISFGLVVFLGARAIQQVPIDAFPDVTPIQVNIYTESPGLAAEDVERLLTFPIESAMAGLPKVEIIRSVSLFGLSYVSVYFEDDMEIYFARRLVMERLLEAKGRIPEGYGEPVMGPNTSGLGQVFWYTLERADKKLTELSEQDLLDLRTLQDWTVRLIMRTAPGVDDVISWGGHEKQYQVLIDPARLIKFDLTFREAIEAVEANNRQVGGQYVNLGSEQYLVRGLGWVRNTEEIGRIIVAERHGTPIFLRDVAQVKEGPAIRFGAVTKDGAEVPFGMVLSRIGTNAKDVVNRVNAKLGIIQQALPEGVRLVPVYERTEIVQKAIKTATDALMEGAVLVAIVLFLFLGEFRSALVVITALPMAMLIAFILMEYWGLSANLMSLAGLAIGIGMMVDGAVVMVENSFRLLAERAQKVSRAAVNKTATVLEAAREVAQPIGFAILIIIVVFIPLFTLTGLEGKLFKPMAYNISFAMAGSLLLTLTLIPVLASLLLKPKEERDTLLVRWVKRGYLPLLSLSLHHRWLVVGMAALLLVLSLSLFPFLGKEFMPTLREESVMFRVTGIPSISLEESIAVSKKIAEAMEPFPEINHTTAMIGRAELGETADVNYMEIYAELSPQEKWREGMDIDQLNEEIRMALEETVPTAVFALTQPIQMRVEELISGVRATLAAKIYGEDLDTLTRLSQEIKEVVSLVPGVRDLSLEANLGKPQLQIQVDRDAMARYGLNADDVLEIVHTGIGGRPVSTLIDGIRRFDILVRFDPVYRNDVEAIRNIPIRTPEGRLISLSRVADIQMMEGYTFVRRESLQRYAVIQMDVVGRDVDGFVKEAQTKIDHQMKLPTGYWIEWGGAFENQQRAMQRLSIIVPLTIFLIFVLLYTAFNSVRYAALIISNVPFALIGGILSLWLTGQYLSVSSVIGFIAVFGVAMLNGIVLVSFINELRERGLSVREAVLKGAELRLRPVLMTASVSILGLIPMLLSTGVGAETQRPLATVVVAGLLSSTVLTLLLLPIFYDWIEGRNASFIQQRETQR
ncbi:MAG: CusA/CzcA family heavy metal efflux RND transporter [Nitrospira sp.]|nr:CusA/CzcA family heavy metal efflux RND transporter [Nitrospira sp.]